LNAPAWRWQWPAIDAELRVAPSVAEVLTSYRQRARQSERGGQLFVDAADPDGLVLALATRPHPADRAGWTWLDLDPDRCRMEIAQANARGLRLVGYWHTHPQVLPRISSTDVASFAAFAARYSTALPCPLAIIVGNPDHHDGIRAWSFRAGRPVKGARLSACLATYSSGSDNEI